MSCASLGLRGDREVVLAAVRQKGQAFYDAAKWFQADRSVRAAAGLNGLQVFYLNH